MVYATIADVEARLGRTLTTAEQGQVTAWFQDLEALVLSRIPGFADQVTAGSPPAGVVTAVFAAAVIRVLRNPEGLRQHTETIDDYSITKTVDTVSSSGLLYLSDDEWNLLGPGTSGDAFTITPSYVSDRDGYWASPTEWVPL